MRQEYWKHLTGNYASFSQMEENVPSLFPLELYLFAVTKYEKHSPLNLPSHNTYPNSNWN